MKRKIYALLICSMLLAVTACGKKENVENVVEQGVEQTEEYETVQEDESSSNEDGVLLGVYEGATGYVSVPMGTYFDGEQKNFCKIKMPLEYLFTACYTEDGDENNISKNDDLVGKMVTPTLDMVSDKLDEQTKASCWVLMMSTGGTTVNYYIIPSTTRNLEDEKAYAGEYKELNHNGRNAIYFVDSNEYVTADVCVSYEVNEDILLYITYEGPAADEIGIDQLAENIYDLVEVIE